MKITIDNVISATCYVTGIKRADLLGPSRLWQFSHPRQEAMLIASELTGASTPKIGRHFGGRDHTTVLHGLKRAKRRAKADIDAAVRLNKIEAASRAYAGAVVFKSRRATVIDGWTFKTTRKG